MSDDTKLHAWHIEEREYRRQEECRDQDRNATLHTVYRTFGDARPTAEVLALIGGNSA